MEPDLTDVTLYVLYIYRRTVLQICTFLDIEDVAAHLGEEIRQRRRRLGRQVLS